MVDWKGLRNKSGLEVIPERVKPASVKTAPLDNNAIPSQGAENVDLRKYTYLRSKLNPWEQPKPYNGTDVVADGIHVNPTKNDTPSSLNIPKMKALPAPSEYPIAVSKGVR
jgi:hypothetical protein